jgi:Bacterial RNA polymerase, alpha chain C terminal domain
MPKGSSPQVPPGTVRDLGLPARAVTALTRAGITTLDDLAGLSRRDLAALDGVGPGTIAAIRLVVPEPGARAAAGADEESPAAHAIPSFESLRAPRRPSAVDLLVPGPAPGPTPPAAGPAPAPRPAEYADLVWLGARMARVAAGVPWRVALWSLRAPVRLLRGLAGARPAEGAPRSDQD